jgi:opacity protein-like surface antigen
MGTSKKNILITLVALSCGTLFAQDKWSIEVRPAVNFATKDLGDANLKTGYGFEAAIGYRFIPHLGAYAGWGWNQFKSDGSSFVGSEADFEETGYTFGLQFVHPIGNSGLSYLIRAGGIYNHIEVENSVGDIAADSGHGLGWELGTGLNVDLGSNWNLRPQLSYRALSRDIKIGTITADVNLNHLTLGIGISKMF